VEEILVEENLEEESKGKQTKSKKVAAADGVPARKKKNRTKSSIKLEKDETPANAARKVAAYFAKALNTGMKFLSKPPYVSPTLQNRAADPLPHKDRIHNKVLAEFDGDFLSK